MLVKEHNWTPNRYRHGWIPLEGIIAKHRAAGVHIDATESTHTGALRLHMISVAPAQRRKGSASAAMRDLIAYADQKGVPMALSPEAHGAGGPTTAALRRWYQRFGFVPNKGRKADFSISESMIRRPIAKQTVSTGSSQGQTVTLNMNTTRVRAYRKLRQKGLPHHQALAMAKRTRMAKAAAWNPALHPRAPKGQTTGGQFAAGQSGAAAANPARGGPGAAVARELAVLRGRLAAVNVRIRATKAQIAKLQSQLSPAQRSQSRSQAARKAAQTRKAHGAKRGAKHATRHAAAPLSPAQRKLIALQRQLAALNAQATRIKAEIAKVSASGIAKAAPYAALHPPIVHHGRINWVDRVGGLPGPIDAIARVLISKGWSEQRAVATAVSTAKKSCATGTAIGGHAHLHPASRAVICAAVADWEAKKAAA